MSPLFVAFHVVAYPGADCALVAFCTGDTYLQRTNPDGNVVREFRRAGEFVVFTFTGTTEHDAIADAMATAAALRPVQRTSALVVVRLASNR